MAKYKYIVVPLLTLVLSQFVKFIIESIKQKKLVWKRLFNGSGGMPSSHTAFSTSITCLVGLNLGFDSPLFGVSLVFMLIIMYDAKGLRAQAGKHAVAINALYTKVSKKKDHIIFEEELGHNPIEVYAGILFGVICALLLNLLF